MKRIVIIHFLVIITFVAFQLNFESSKRAKIRSISSFSITNCFKAIAGFGKETEVITELSGATDYNQIIEILRARGHEKISFNELKEIMSSPVMNKIEIQLQDLGRYYDKISIDDFEYSYEPISRNDFKRAVSYLVLNKLWEKREDDFARYYLKYRESGLHIVQKHIYLDESEVPVNYFVGRYFLKTVSEGEVDRDMFSKALEIMKKGDFYVEDAPTIIQNLSVALEKLGYPQLVSPLKESLKESGYMDMAYLSKNLETAMDIIDGKKVPTKQITSGYELVLYLAHTNAGASDIKKIPFVKLNEIDPVSLIRKIQDKGRGAKQILETLENDFNISLNRLLSLDYYEKELNNFRVYDQCDVGSCWVQGSLVKMEIELSKKFRDPIPLSTDYLYTQIYYSRMMSHIGAADVVSLRPHAFVNFFQSSEGGFAAEAQHYMKLMGVVPSTVWKPKRSIHESGVIREFSKAVSKFVKENENLSAIDYRSKITEFYYDFFGRPPESFTFRGKRYTPLTFYEEFYEHGLHDVERWYYEGNSFLAKREDVHTIEIPFYKEDKFENHIIKINQYEKTYEDLSNKVVESIDRGKPIAAAFRWLKKETFDKGKSHFINNENGMITAPYRFHKGDLEDVGSHLVTIIGYRRGDDGLVKSFKILNSYGEDSGDVGVYHMDANYFKHFIQYLYLSRKGEFGFRNHHLDQWLQPDKHLERQYSFVTLSH